MTLRETDAVPQTVERAAQVTGGTVQVHVTLRETDAVPQTVERGGTGHRRLKRSETRSR